jgi:hypothetical protein
MEADAKKGHKIQINGPVSGGRSIEPNGVVHQVRAYWTVKLHLENIVLSGLWGPLAGASDSSPDSTTGKT